MLVLTRFENQTIVINDTIKVKILAVKGKNVRLGIEAPEEVRVNREEIQEKIWAEANNETLVQA